MTRRGSSTFRSRRSSDRALLALALSGLALAAQAQEAPAPAAPSVATQAPVQGPAQSSMMSPILTVDPDRLFTESAFGKRVSAQIETRSQALAAENRAIEADLTTEEQGLTDARAKLPDAEFRKRADDFDAKVQRIRKEQDDKARALTEFRDSEQKRFLGQLGDVLADIARARGAIAVLDRRSVLVSADAIDITEAAVAEVDTRLGDGSEK